MASLLDELSELESDALRRIEAAASPEDVQVVHADVLGRKGALTALLKKLKGLDNEQKRAVGQRSNAIKTRLTEAVSARQEALLDAASPLPAGFDATRVGTPIGGGGLHPITLMRNDLDDAFASLGFEIYAGPHISSEQHAFDVLNFPVDHPARDSMDTYWLAGTENKGGAERLCLRPHLTGASVRYMREHEPPFRFVYPGRVYRNETTDASHERAFFQYEALIVEKDMPFAAGQLLIDTILAAVFGRVVRTRMRAGFFPFVEPGFEIDMQCLVCDGAGCKVCGRVGWLEVMPGGPPHPEVMRAGGIDPNEWEGFYINIGLDRLVMMRWGVDDVRLFHSGDLRFLTQFS